MVVVQVSDREADMKQDIGSLPVASSPSHADIARKAYDLYVERGAQDGGDVADWLEAERQLTGVTASRPRLVRARTRAAKTQSATTAA